MIMMSAELATTAITAALRDGQPGTPPDLAGFSKDYQAAFDRFLVLVRAFYSGDVRFGELAKDPDLRQGLVDMLTGVTDTPQAVNVTNALRASLDGKSQAMMRGSS